MVLGYKFGGCSDGDFFFFTGIGAWEKGSEIERKRETEKQSFRFESLDLERENKWMSIFVR